MKNVANKMNVVILKIDKFDELEIVHLKLLLKCLMRWEQHWEVVVVMKVGLTRGLGT